MPTTTWAKAGLPSEGDVAVIALAQVLNYRVSLELDRLTTRPRLAHQTSQEGIAGLLRELLKSHRLEVDRFNMSV